MPLLRHEYDEFQRRMRALQDAAFQTNTQTDPKEWQNIAALTEAVLKKAREFYNPPPTTNCLDHPYGPVEPGTDGDCLLCCIRRARGHKVGRTRPREQQEIQPVVLMTDCASCGRGFRVKPSPDQPTETQCAMCRDHTT